MRLKLLTGIVVKPLKVFTDERGFFAEIFKSNWKDLFTDEIVQANLSITHPGVVRAWHKHERGQVDYFIVLNGTAKICVYDEGTKELDEVVSAGKCLQAVRVPGRYWHGFKAVGEEPTVLIYFLNKLYDPTNPDEIRRPWNDPEIVPISINGGKDDPRCGRPWDWFAPPHR